MMRYKLLVIFFFFFVVQNAFCQYSILGSVFDEKTKRPIEYALVAVDNNELWAITNAKGEFILKNVPKGEIRLIVSYLGYVKKTFDLKIADNTEELKIYLQQDNLAIKEVIITAQRKEDASSSYLIDRKGLEHIQMLNVSDAMSLQIGRAHV